MKITLLEKAFACSFVLMLTFSCIIFSSQCSDIENSIVRMHIIANSNSKEDQAVKLEVRDVVVAQGAELLKTTKTKEEAMAVLSENLKLLGEVAKKQIYENGDNLDVDVTLEKTYFPTRKYENITLPAGQYDSILVKIGKARGENFWCVMFPALCIPAAQKENALNDVLTNGEFKIIDKPQTYKIEWKTAELFEKLRNYIKRLKE